MKPEPRMISIRAMIGFCDDFKCGGILLGQHGFLSEFKITCNQRENYFRNWVVLQFELS
jgi:hypothetical protein